MTIEEGTIRIDSKKYGELVIMKEQVYHFPKSIVGFADITEFALLPFGDSELYVLQSLSEDISFFIIPSVGVAKNYAFEIDGETALLLDLRTGEDVITFFIVNLIDGLPYINPKAPILIVPSSHKGCQYIIHDVSVPVREPLLKEETDDAHT